MGEAVSRARRVDWQPHLDALDAFGWASESAFLGKNECRSLIALFEDESVFRKRIVMGKHGFGQGEYRYFGYPLPERVAQLRRELYAPLAPLANRWRTLLGESPDFPLSHPELVEQCHRVGQNLPTPLLLRYRAGDYNRLHQDLYGALSFPIQAAILLDEPGRDFSGGEFVLTEQRARMQSRPIVVPLRQGDLLLFAVSARPVAGKSRMSRAVLRHGVSEVRSGKRHTLGIIFHESP